MRLLILFALFSRFAFAEIDDLSFKNNDKYQFLPEMKIGISDSFNIKVQFVPPKGKKVNLATFVKIWEKEKKGWELSETLDLANSKQEFSDNLLLHNVLLKSKKSEVAIEIDFIHCTYSGGQCDQERYLGKIKRLKGTQTSLLYYHLKI
ncbi:MAG: hypothetical protein KBD76_05430 [Bacteriovorax sp.]|nr:hypothetical protein [Bacteriovorax sp.]